MVAQVAYNCAAVASLPFKGAEILFISAIFLFLAVTFAVTFFDVTIKQLYPSFLDPTVAARLAEVQRLFPNLGASDVVKGGDGGADALTVKRHTIAHPETGAPIEYDAVTAAQPYIATKSVDDDLLYVLANNQCFSTISGYCSCTVRGYVMLSSILTAAGMCMGYMWTHNALVDPKAGNWIDQFALLGYLMGFLTALVMCGPDSNAVYRNADMLLFTNYPLSGPASWVGKLHGLGIGAFVLLPFLAHLINALLWGSSMPNYHTVITGSAGILVMALCFGASGWLKGKIPGFTDLVSEKLSILFETLTLFAAFLSFIQYEVYASAVCAGHADLFNGLVLLGMFAPIALMARRQCNAPTTFAFMPSLLLMNQGQPVATFGPCPTLDYDQTGTAVPHIKSKLSTIPVL